MNSLAIFLLVLNSTVGLPCVLAVHSILRAAKMKSDHARIRFERTICGTAHLGNFSKPNPARLSTHRLCARFVGVLGDVYVRCLIATIAIVALHGSDIALRTLAKMSDCLKIACACLGC